MKFLSQFLLLLLLNMFSISCSNLPVERNVDSVGQIEREGLAEEDQVEHDRLVRQNLLHQMNRGESKSSNRR
jgi:hypothetical protein